MEPVALAPSPRLAKATGQRGPALSKNCLQSGLKLPGTGAAAGGECQQEDGDKELARRRPPSSQTRLWAIC